MEMLDEYTAGSTLSKTRYRIPAGKHEFEVDVFHGKLDGLVVAEVELASESDVVALPEWIRAEVTSDFQYKNTSLIAATEIEIHRLLAAQ
jgi:adenylate cyclase